MGETSAPPARGGAPLGRNAAGRWGPVFLSSAGLESPVDFAAFEVEVDLAA